MSEEEKTGKGAQAGNTESLEEAHPETQVVNSASKAAEKTLTNKSDVTASEINKIEVDHHPRRHGKT